MHPTQEKMISDQECMHNININNYYCPATITAEAHISHHLQGSLQPGERGTEQLNKRTSLTPSLSYFCLLVVCLRVVPQACFADSIDPFFIARPGDRHDAPGYPPFSRRSTQYEFRKRTA